MEKTELKSSIKNFLLANGVAFLFSAMLFHSATSSSLTTVYVYPSTSTVTIGQYFTIEVRISDVIDLYGWEFKLGWNSNLLDAVDVVEGPFLKQGGSTFFNKTIDNSAGYILAYCTLLYDVPGVNGSGTLATVEFYAEMGGTSPLDLYDTELVDSFDQLIDHSVNNGSVTVSASVGGVYLPVDTFALLAPWVRAGLIFVTVIVTIVIIIKCRKKDVGLSLLRRLLREGYETRQKTVQREE
jgi:hypothetical protein